MDQDNNTKDDFYIDDEEIIEPEADKVLNQVETESDNAPELYSPYEYDDDTVYSRKSKKKDTDKKASKILIRSLIIAACILIITAIGCFAFVMNTPQDKVLMGVKCLNIDMGNMTLAEAKAVFAGELEVNIAGISVRSNNKTYDIASETIDLKILPDKTAEKVFNFGKGGNVFENAYDLALSMTGNIDILPVTTYDETKLKEELAKIGAASEGVLVAHSAILLNDTTARLTPGKRGFDGNVDDALKKVKSSIENDIYTEIDVTFNLAEPEKMTLEQVQQAVNVPAKDATYIKSNGELAISAEQPGVEVDVNKCNEALAQLSVDSGIIDVPCNPVSPQKTSEDLKGNLFNYTLGTFSTSYATGGNRGQNIAIAAGKINNTIIVPGETFSFNNTVGRRTVENGFRSAPEYLNGETVEGIGGGTCQVSTTLYSAVLYADLKIVSRRNHSMSIGYAPLGQDATVSDGGIDFKFENNTNYPIKIKATASGGKLTVDIIGTTPEVERTVKITHSSSNTENGGKTVKTTRTVYDTSGNVIKTENIGTSRYKPH